MAAGVEDPSSQAKAEIRLHMLSNDSLATSQGRYARFRDSQTNQPNLKSWIGRTSHLGSGIGNYRVPTGSPAFWLETGLGERDRKIGDHWPWGKVHLKSSDTMPLLGRVAMSLLAPARAPIEE
jgi:hypothetical protein